MGIFGGMFKSEREELNAVIAQLKGELAALEEERLARRSANRLEADIRSLKNQKVDLEIQIAKINEDNDRKLREVTHKVGLEQKRQEQELANGKREAVLAVREENLAKDKERFADEMKYIKDRMETENEYVREMFKQVLERLPTVSITSGGE